MVRSRSQILLWFLTGVLVLALPLLAVLQVRWARGLWQAESERLVQRVSVGLDSLVGELEDQLLGWHLQVQSGTTLGGSRSTEGRELDPLLGDLIVDTLLVHPGDSGEPARWFRIDAEDRREPLAAPPPALASLDALDEYQPRVLPRPLGEESLVLDVLVPDPRGLLAARPEAPLFAATPRFLVLLDRERFEAWLEALAREHWSELRGDLDFSIIQVSPDQPERLLVGASPMGWRADEEIGRLDANLDLRRAIGGLLTPQSDACPSETPCFPEPDSSNEPGAGNDLGPASESDETVTPVFLTLPGGDETWRLDVRILREGLASPLRELWARNLAIGLVALGVLAVAVVLLILLTLQSQRLARAQFEFVTGVSHELRTPLSVLRSAAANLEDGLVQEADQVQRYGRVLRKEVGRLNDLVERILGFTRDQATEDGVPPRADLAASVERVVRRLAAEIADRGAEVEVRVADDLPPVRAHDWLLDSVLHNLLSNALKYGGERIRVEVATTRLRRRPAVALTVRDWGPGLNRSERRRVFEPFFRGAQARDGQVPGTGLGLSWVARLTRRAGGKLIVESSPGQGSRFGVELPALGATGGTE